MRSRSASPTSSISGSSRVLEALPLLGPPAELSIDVAATAGEVAEPDGVDVDGVEVGEHVDQVLAGRPAQLEREQRRLVGTVEHGAVDELHHVERRPVDRLVGAEAERPRHRHRAGLADGADQQVLTGHVVGAGEHVAERRPAQHELHAVSSGDGVREVGSPAGDQPVLEGRHRALDVGGQPRPDPLFLDPSHPADRSGALPTAPCRTPRTAPERACAETCSHEPLADVQRDIETDVRDGREPDERRGRTARRQLERTGTAAPTPGAPKRTTAPPGAVSRSAPPGAEQHVTAGRLRRRGPSSRRRPRPSCRWRGRGPGVRRPGTAPRG